MDAVNIQWRNIEDEKFLIFEFQGNLTEAEARKAVASWHRELEKNVPLFEKVNVAWDCSQMKKYEAKAALVWKSALPSFSQSIEDIWLITTNPFFKMGARTVTLLTDFKLHLASSSEDFERKVLEKSLS